MRRDRHTIARLRSDLYEITSEKGVSGFDSGVLVGLELNDAQKQVTWATWINAGASIAIFLSSCCYCTVATWQWKAMDSQTRTMQSTAEIERVSLAAEMQLTLARGPAGQNESWYVTSKWENHGKTNAVSFEADESFTIFHGRSAMQEVQVMISQGDFPDNDITHYTKAAIMPDDGIAFNTAFISIGDALQIASGRATAVLSDKLVYKDIFGVTHTRLTCQRLDFVMMGGRPEMTMPAVLSPSCDQTT